LFNSGLSVSNEDYNVYAYERSRMVCWHFLLCCI